MSSFGTGMLTGIIIGRNRAQPQASTPIARASKVDWEFDQQISLGIEAYFKCVEDSRCGSNSDCAPCLEKFASYLKSASDYETRAGQKYMAYYCTNKN